MDMTSDPIEEDKGTYDYLSDPIWTVKEVSDYLKISEYVVRDLCRKKDLPHFKVGYHLIRFDRDDVMKWKTRNKERCMR